jgi:hypothetical protein
MPAGYQWTHEELVLAVRQRLDGIQETDRKPPVVATASTEQETTLLIGGQPVLRLPDRQAMETAAGVLRQTATDRALTREDFGYGVDAGRIQLLVRNRAFLEITQEAVKRSGERASDLARHCCEAVAEAYPALTRPFPGQVPPGRR